jgi:drug/metabolite transporter (DMT)-like permease
MAAAFPLPRLRGEGQGEGQVPLLTDVQANASCPWPAMLAAAAGSVMVGFMPLVTLRLYADGLDASSMLVWRYGIALVPLILAATLARHSLKAAWRAGAWRIALVGATLGVGQTLCFWESLHWLDTSVAILLFYTYPALTLALDRLIFGRAVRPRAVVCVGLILAGAGLVLLPGASGGNLDLRGLFWLLPSPIFYAFYLAANSVLMRRHPPLIGAGFLYLGLALAFLGAGLFQGVEVPTTRAAWLLILFIALGPGALTVTLFSYSVPRLGPASYAIIANTELLTVVAVGVLLLGEPMTPGRALGGLLIVAGILTHALAHNSGPARSFSAVRAEGVAS